MPLRVDELHMELSPLPERGANTGAASRELLGGKYGELLKRGDPRFQFSQSIQEQFEAVALMSVEELRDLELVQCSRHAELRIR